VDLLIELQYLPPQIYFCEIASCEKIILESFETYQKQSYRNRCYIKGANKIEVLTVPVVHGNKHYPIRDIRIDEEQPWRNIHLRTLASAYGKAPYFDYFFEPLQSVYDKKHTFLLDLNLDLLTFCLELLKFKQKTEFSTEFKVMNTDQEGLIDKRSQIHPKKDNLIPDYQYTQVFGVDFVPNLSILDLLFCQGLQSGTMLRKASMVKRE
jgi:hypothetical protein